MYCVKCVRSTADGCGIDRSQHRLDGTDMIVHKTSCRDCGEPKYEVTPLIGNQGGGAASPIGGVLGSILGAAASLIPGVGPFLGPLVGGIFGGH